jgi:hypothetical protein
MFQRAVLVVLAACGSQPKPVPPEPPQVSSAKPPSCPDAAAALEKGTIAIRPPGSSILRSMAARCGDDGWAQQAISCFTSMSSKDAVDHDLGQCAGLLPLEARNRMFAAIGSDTSDGRIAISISRARLAAMSLPVPACERFVSTVANVLTCEHIALEVRVQLGNEASDFWSLPTENLPASAAREMAAICTDSLGKLQRQAQDAGCMP